MTKEDKYFDDLLRDKLTGFAETPPAHVWEGIQKAQMAARKKKLFFYLRLSGAAAAIFIAFLVGRQIAIQPEEGLLPTEVVEAPVNLQEGQESESKTITLDQDTKLDNQDLITSNVNESTAANSTGEFESDKTLDEFNQTQSTAIQSSSKATETNQLSEATKDNLVATNDQQNGIESSSYSQTQQATSLLGAQTQNRESESFSFLKSLTKDLFSFDFKPEEKQLATITRNNEPQSLTVDDLDAIERNQQLLALNEKTKQVNPWKVAAMVSPNIAVNQTSYNESYASNMSNPGSKENLSIGGGLAVSYKAGKRLSVQSGVYYSQLGQSSSNQFANYQSEFIGLDNTAKYFNTSLAVKSGQALLNASAGVVEFDNLPSNARIGNSLESENSDEAVFLTASEFQQNFEYIEIPLNLRYLLIDSKIDINILGGFSSNWLIANDAYLESKLGRERIGETRDMNKVSYSTSFGIGFGYGISNKVSMHLEPQIKYFLGSLSSNSQVSFKPYTIGIYTGLSYKF